LSSCIVCRYMSALFLWKLRSGFRGEDKGRLTGSSSGKSNIGMNEIQGRLVLIRIFGRFTQRSHSSPLLDCHQQLHISWCVLSPKTTWGPYPQILVIALFNCALLFIPYPSFIAFYVQFANANVSLIGVVFATGMKGSMFCIPIKLTFILVWSSSRSLKVLHPTSRCNCMDTSDSDHIP
jgi:hypothetical protein